MEREGLLMHWTEIDYAALEMRAVRHYLRQRRKARGLRVRVWLVVKLWPIMPRRARVWAFLNDC